MLDYKTYRPIPVQSLIHSGRLAGMGQPFKLEGSGCCLGQHERCLSSNKDSRPLYFLMHSSIARLGAPDWNYSVLILLQEVFNYIWWRVVLGAEYDFPDRGSF